MSSKIEQLIDEIEEYIASCKYKTLSNTHIIVNKDEIDELLRELKMKTPDEIKRYQKIISNKEAILNDARDKAAALIKEATDQTNELINEHEIMLQAYEQANEVVTLASAQAQDILDTATVQANSMRESAVQYTDDLLAHVEEVVAHYMNTAGARFDSLMDSLNECYETVRANRAELHPQEAEAIQLTEELAAEANSGLLDLDLI